MNKFKSVVLLSFLCIGSQAGFSAQQLPTVDPAVDADKMAELLGVEERSKRGGNLPTMPRIEADVALETSEPTIVQAPLPQPLSQNFGQVSKAIDAPADFVDQIVDEQRDKVFKNVNFWVSTLKRRSKANGFLQFGKVQCPELYEKFNKITNINFEKLKKPELKALETELKELFRSMVEQRGLAQKMERSYTEIILELQNIADKTEYIQSVPVRYNMFSEEIKENQNSLNILFDQRQLKGDSLERMWDSVKELKERVSKEVTCVDKLRNLYVSNKRLAKIKLQQSQKFSIEIDEIKDLYQQGTASCHEIDVKMDDLYERMTDVFIYIGHAAAPTPRQHDDPLSVARVKNAIGEIITGAVAAYDSYPKFCGEVFEKVALSLEKLELATDGGRLEAECIVLIDELVMLKQEVRTFLGNPTAEYNVIFPWEVVVDPGRKRREMWRRVTELLAGCGLKITEEQVALTQLASLQTREISRPSHF